MLQSHSPSLTTVTHKRLPPDGFVGRLHYTMCVIFTDEWHLAKHGDIFETDSAHQDVLWKFNIPWKERLKVLKLLDAYNLNAFSLFGSEESLMETTALRELEF